MLQIKFFFPKKKKNIFHESVLTKIENLAGNLIKKKTDL